MKTNIYVILLSIVFFTTSCRKALETNSIRTSSEILPECKNVSCPEVDVEYFTILGTGKVPDKINTEIQDFIIQSLFIGEDENERKAPSIEIAIEEFIQRYRLHSAEFPGLAAEYFAEVIVSQTFNSKELLSVTCQNYLYTGGAHGYGEVTFKNYDPNTGDLLSYEDLFEDVATFETLAENLFRKKHNIPAADHINASGFWFEDDAFYLPETFGISNEFVVLRYNQYEIAPYATGPIILEIPIALVKDILEISIE